MDDSQVHEAARRFGIVGRSEGLLNAVWRAIKVAPIDLSVLVEGESGTGKEFFPQIIHAYGARKHARYIAVNCGAIPEGTIDSELFGHEKGAFTGAVSTRKGYFEEADGGTIFLDEVGELPLTTQARLLRVLETGEFIKVGSSTVQKTDIRVVAATNVDMAEAVRRGRFREDLYYRLSTVSIQVPALRDRGSWDISLLVNKFAADFAERYRTPLPEFDRSAMEMLVRYRWPGNVRQLKNVVDQMSLFEAGKTITPDVLQHYLPVSSYAPAIATGGPRTTAEHSYDRDRDALFNMIFGMQRRIDELSNEVAGLRSAQQQPAGQECVRLIADGRRDQAEMPDDVSYSEVVNEAPAASLRETERDTIIKVLERNGGRRKETAKELRISERTLYRKIKEYGLEE